MSDPVVPASPAVRLIFEYEGDEVRLVAQQPVDVAVTGFDLAGASGPGYYVETRGVEGALARVPARAAFASSAEVFPEDHGEPISRVDVERPAGAFTVVVPAHQAATSVAVVQLTGAAPGASVAGPGANDLIEIATFPLTSP